jgi:hypothetical protein
MLKLSSALSMVQRKQHRYFTVLINLNPLDAYCGGTEVWIDSLKKGDLVSFSLHALANKFLCVYCSLGFPEAKKLVSVSGLFLLNVAVV